ncbi:hypothetical protein ACFFX0_12785 [Citricoccus parietis]|uniref:Uncharacterized protein n=1 Tax=Citricoccus parietis TaxID=592307 RepID=A0ABV5FZB5_9MICC
MQCEALRPPPATGGERGVLVFRWHPDDPRFSRGAGPPSHGRCGTARWFPRPGSRSRGASVRNQADAATCCVRPHRRDHASHPPRPPAV